MMSSLTQLNPKALSLLEQNFRGIATACGKKSERIEHAATCLNYGYYSTWKRDIFMRPSTLKMNL